MTRTHAIAALALITAAGCLPPKQHGEDFVDQDHPTSVGLVAQAQAAAGAKQDGMLYDCHFRGDRLSPLGQGKLDLILKATVAGDPVEVYLAMPPAQVDDARRAAVTAYLRHAGVPTNAILLADGPNPHCTTASSYDLAAVYKDGNANTGTAADLGVTGGLGANGPGGTIGK